MNSDKKGKNEFVFSAFICVHLWLIAFLILVSWRFLWFVLSGFRRGVLAHQRLKTFVRADGIEVGFDL
jgi:hypothetical protein